MTRLRLNELTAGEEIDLGHSGWHELDQSTINTFGRVTLDEQWIHTDPERARRGPFGFPIAHGFLTLSLCTRVLEECLTFPDASMIVNYGLERVRFPSPTRVNSRLHGHVVLLTSKDVPGGVQSVVQITISDNNAAKPACVADMVVRFMR